MTSPWEAVGYSRLADGSPIPTLSTLQTALDDPAVAVTPDQQQRLSDDFIAATGERLAQEATAAQHRRQAHVSSLSEEVRQLLIEAAYIELALAANRDLFDEALPLDFSEQAYQRLKRHKVPFAGALKVAGTDLPRPRPEDPLYEKFRDSKKDVLARRFEAIRSTLGERLRQLMEERGRANAAGGERATPMVVPECELYSATSP